MNGFMVPDALDGERIDRAVAMHTEASRADVAKLISAGGVTVDGVVIATRSRRLAAGEEVELVGSIETIQRTVEADDSVEFGIVFEDADVIVVNKPAGLVVHPGPGNWTGTLANGLLAKFPEVGAIGDSARPGIVHRLDVGTSGLLVVARSERAYESLVRQMTVHSARRTYRSLVHGLVQSDGGIIDARLGRSGRDRTKVTVKSDGRVARTEYEVLRRFQRPVEVTEVECRLETGRTHQIRVHLTAIGHPVVADERYGRGGETFGLQRPFLHAFRLAFEHPESDDSVDFEAPLPDDLVAVLGQLR